MARIRTIKPEFFTSEDIVSLSPFARLLYIALWCEADREGRLLWKPLTFKLRYFPADSFDIGELCRELIAANLAIPYGDGYAYIPSFGKHQHVNPRETASSLPCPPDFIPATPKKISEDVREEVMERDGNSCIRCSATDDLTLDHILPQSCEGPHISENLRVMCRRCNAGRPVAGQGLIDDLARDGLTIEGLRVKFAIDASPRVSTRANQNRHAQVGREGKGKEGDIGASKTRKTSIPENFEISERVKVWAASKGHTNLQAHFESFQGKCKAKSYQYTDWDEAFMNAIRDDWAKLKQEAGATTRTRKAL